MANTKSAEKHIRQDAERHRRNQAAKSRMKTAVKKVRTALEEGDVEAANEYLPTALSVVDRATSKGVIHRNKAARTKSRLVAAVRRAEG